MYIYSCATIGRYVSVNIFFVLPDGLPGEKFYFSGKHNFSGSRVCKSTLKLVRVYVWGFDYRVQHGRREGFCAESASRYAENGMGVWSNCSNCSAHYKHIHVQISRLQFTSLFSRFLLSDPVRITNAFHECRWRVQSKMEKLIIN